MFTYSFTKCTFFEYSLVLINIETVVMVLQLLLWTDASYILMHWLVFEKAVLERRLWIWAYTCDLLSEPKSSFTSKTTPHGRSITKIPKKLDCVKAKAINNLLQKWLYIIHINTEMRTENYIPFISYLGLQSCTKPQTWANYLLMFSFKWLLYLISTFFLNKWLKKYNT